MVIITFPCEHSIDLNNYHLEADSAGGHFKLPLALFIGKQHLMKCLTGNRPASLPLALAVSCDWDALPFAASSASSVLLSQDPALLVALRDPSFPIRIVSSSQFPKYLICTHIQANSFLKTVVWPDTLKFTYLTCAVRWSLNIANMPPTQVRILPAPPPPA